jgi:hypothetical protein
MKAFALAPLFSLLALVSSSVVATDAPPFPGQVRVNAALADMKQAKEKASTDTSAALKHMIAAHNHLNSAQQNKGSHQDLAEAVSQQAIQLLKAGNAKAALIKIDNAIDLISKAAAQSQSTARKK